MKQRKAIKLICCTILLTFFISMTGCAVDVQMPSVDTSSDSVSVEPEKPITDDNGSETSSEGGTITDSWKQIIASVNDGTYKSKYNIGDTKALDLGSEGIVEMQIVAFNADELADGSGTAAITWISKQLLNSDHRMNPDYATSPEIMLGIGNVGGWAHSEMRTWLKSDVKPLIPSTVRNSIKLVKKYSTSFDISYNWIQNDESVDDVRIPSYREMGGAYSDYESNGPVYTGLFTSDSDRVKQKIGESSASCWWLRSVGGYDNDYFSSVLESGYVDDYSLGASGEFPVALGFCL